ncbi:MAG: DMT family transporter [Roseibacillus sp.]
MGSKPEPVTFTQTACQILPRLLQLNLLVLLWSLTGILGEVISMQPTALVFWRTAIAAAVFYFFCRLRRPHLLRISRPHLILSLTSGFILGMHWLCFFGAIALSNVSVGLAGFAATSLFTALLEPLIEKKRPETRKVLLALLVAVGIVLIAGAKTEVPHPLLGLSIALIGALLAAIYSLTSKSLITAAVPGPTLMLYQIPAANLATVAAILIVPRFGFEVPQTVDWPALLFLAIICTFFAYLWFARILKHVTAYTMNLAINFEPVYGILLAAIFFSEHQSLTPLFYLGTATIVLANLIHARQPQ